MTSTIATQPPTAIASVELAMPPYQKQVFRKDYKPSEYRIKHISMDFDLGYNETEVFISYISIIFYSFDIISS